jgi:hypothetical protein
LASVQQLFCLVSFGPSGFLYHFRVRIKRALQHPS